MPSFGSETGKVLYLIVCGAPPAADTPLLVKQHQDQGWDVCVIATPHGARWLDIDQLEALTGHEVRTDFRQPDEPEFQPRGDAVLLAPATFNTINKWALGINDTLALGLLNEAIGRQVPVTVRPVVNSALAAHPAYQRALQQLSDLRVSIDLPE
jgi:phosphopantothenoylcysteine synthetase/decarboxylase